MRRWERQGRPVPPPPKFKRQALRCYARKFGLKIFVETGTLHGDTVAAMRSGIDRLFTIELDPVLFAAAQARFLGDSKIRVIFGNSATELDHLLPQLTQPALFWLDGHYSGSGTARGTIDTPILKELETILRRTEQDHVILVDDARCSGSDPAHPSIEEVRHLVISRRPAYHFAVADDSIRITPPR